LICLADPSFAVAVDIGGTFTDIALHDASSGRIWRAKTPSVPSDPSQAFLTGIRLALEDAGCAAPSLERVLHGTTVATNMILEGKGARTALITTAGFRHVLAIGRQDIPRRANYLAWIKPDRPVPPSRVFEVRERIGAGGAVIEPLDEKSVTEAARSCRTLKVEAVAVCLLHSFANPAHERRIVEMLRQALPGVAVTATRGSRARSMSATLRSCAGLAKECSRQTATASTPNLRQAAAAASTLASSSGSITTPPAPMRSLTSNTRDAGTGRCGFTQAR